MASVLTEAGMVSLRTQGGDGRHLVDGEAVWTRTRKFVEQVERGQSSKAKFRGVMDILSRRSGSVGTAAERAEREETRRSKALWK